MDDKQQIQQDKREARRKRRIKNQILAYIVVVIFITALAAGIVLGVRQLMAERQAKEAEQQISQDALEELLASEEELTTPEPTQEPVEELTPEQKLDEIVNAGIEVMPLEDKVAGLFIVTPESITGVSTAVKAGEGTQKALAQYAVGGIIYDTKNIRSEEQFREMLDNTELYTKYPIFLAVSEEGGNASVVAKSGIGTNIESAKVLGQSGDTDIAYQAGVNVGSNLAGLGINLNLAPVADITTLDNSFMEERSFGSGAWLAGSMAGSFIQGMKSVGVVSCVKHFPGQGSTADNPDKGRSVTDRTEEQFRSEEFIAFQAAIDAGVDMVMISNIQAPALTGDNEPCVFSEKLVTDILRGEMGYDGVIISDALNMPAVSDYYSSDDAVIRTLKAGCDMILAPEDFETAYKGVLQAVHDGVISEERIDDALRRIYRIKYADRINEVNGGRE